MREPRIAVMIRGEVSWRDGVGVMHNVPASMEDRSIGGACIRVGTPIGVGASIQVHCRREQFTGISKYCRHDGKEFLVGIQRDNGTIAIAASAETRAQSENLANQDGTAAGKPSGDGNRQTLPVVPEASGATDAPPGIAPPCLPESKRIPEATPVNRHAAPMEEPRKEIQPVETRKPMRHKLFELSGWRIGKKGSGTSAENENPSANQPNEGTAQSVRSSASRFHVDLRSPEEIYRAAGVLSLHGYSVYKIVEMLRSEHIRGMSKELKRAAVLMALDVAKVPVDQVLRDAKARTDALDSYEAEQRRQIEAEWARKAEENARIQAELEQINEQYMARIRGNQQSLEREKATFKAWLTGKQQEAQSITEAAELCRTEVKTMAASSAQ